MASQLDYQIFKSEFESHWMRPSYGLMPHLSKNLGNIMALQVRKWSAS